MNQTKKHSLQKWVIGIHPMNSKRPSSNVSAILLAAMTVLLSYSTAQAQDYMEHFDHLQAEHFDHVQPVQFDHAQPGHFDHAQAGQFEHVQTPHHFVESAPSPQVQTASFDAISQLESREAEQTKYMCGVDQYSNGGLEPKWRNARLVPWESYAYGEYIGPPRTPHVPAYRLRVDDQVEFVFQVTRNHFGQDYVLSAGDTIRITSPADERLNEATRLDGITIMPDGNIALDLIGNVRAAGKTVAYLKSELDSLYARFYKTDPKVVVSGIQTGTQLRDFLDSIDARSGAGGFSREVNVNPDGTVRLPLVGTVGVVGLSLDELEREINMRYAQELQGLRVTPILTQRAPRFIYVAGEVATPGRFELTGPTSAMQAIALAGGWNVGGNLRQIVVFRRDKNWRLMATKLDLAGGLFGKRPIPSGEIWLRDSDIVLVPKTPILRLADAVELYFTRTLYGIFPAELGGFDGQAAIGVQ